jgi:hypothetical protein
MRDVTTSKATRQQHRERRRNHRSQELSYGYLNDLSVQYHTEQILDHPIICATTILGQNRIFGVDVLALLEDLWPKI